MDVVRERERERERPALPNDTHGERERERKKGRSQFNKIKPNYALKGPPPFRNSRSLYHLQTLQQNHQSLSLYFFPLFLLSASSSAATVSEPLTSASVFESTFFSSLTTLAGPVSSSAAAESFGRRPRRRLPLPELSPPSNLRLLLGSLELTLFLSLETVPLPGVASADFGRRPRLLLPMGVDPDPSTSCRSLVERKSQNDFI